MSLSNFFRQFNCASNNGAISTNNTRQSKRKLKHNNSNLSNNRPSAPISPDHDSNHSINKIESSPECGQDFYEIGRFKVALKRCDNGAKLANDLNEMILERAKIEDDYGKSLKAWNNKWKKLLNSETNEEYGETTKNAWLAFLEAGNKTADIHIDLSKKIIEQPVTSIKSWVKINYQKHILNFKKTKDFEERFEEAQKNWSNLYHKMEKCEKEFKESIQTTLHCEQTSKSAESNPKYSSEQKYKLQEKAIKAKNDQAKAKEKYQESVIQLDLYRPRYVEQMQVEFKKTEHFEQERMLTFKQVLLKCHDLLEKQHSDDRFDDLYLELQKKINEINPSVDLEYWSNRFGPGTPQNWPVFIDHEKNIKQ